MEHFNGETMPMSSNSIQAEQAIIGSILIDPGCLPELLGKISSTDFCYSVNRTIYQAAAAMYENDEAIDQVTLIHHMVQHGANGGQMQQYISKLMGTAPAVANTKDYAKIVIEQAQRRQIVEMTNKLAAMANDPSVTAQKMIEAVEQGINNINISCGDEKGSLVHITEGLLSAYDSLEARATLNQPVPGLQTGLPELDESIAGLGKSNLVILAARPAMGKTALAVKIALEVGIHSGKDVAIYSLEMSMEEIALRLVSQESHVEMNKLTTGHLTEQDWANIAVAAGKFEKSGIYINQDSSVTVADIKSNCRKWPNLGLIVIDYIQLMSSADGRTNQSGNRQQIVAEISRALKVMAKELNVPVLCLSQLNRANESRQEKRPMLSDLRESGAIEQDADVVMFLYREQYYKKSVLDPDIAECIIAKNRHGATETVKLKWVPEYTSFESLVEGNDLWGELPFTDEDDSTRTPECQERIPDV